jgi:DNA ligase (NAD+)
MFTTHDEELKYLEKLGFATNPLNKKLNNLQEIWDYSREMENNKTILKYQIDGLVVKINDNNIKDQLGVVGKTPRGWCAIKFTPDEVSTKILGITWQVGRTGKITPVLELEPVNIQGSVVRRATMHNYKEVVESNLQIGDLAIIHKAGDIIPEVKQIIHL